MRKIVLFLIRLYQLTLSGLLGGRCRFVPSCSTYALEAVERHGAFRGGLLSFVRLLKCHPFHPGGVDPVPPVHDSLKDKTVHREIQHL